MDATANSRPDFRDAQAPDNPLPFQQAAFPHASQHYQQQPPFSQPLASASSPIHNFLPSNRPQPLPQPFSQQPQSLLTSTPLPHAAHDTARQPSGSTPSTSSNLARNQFAPGDSLLRPPQQLSQPASAPLPSQAQSAFQPPPPQFKPLPGQAAQPFLDSQQKSRDAHPTQHQTRLPSSTQLPHQQSQQPDQPDSQRQYATQTGVPSLSNPSGTLSSLDKKPEPFPYSKSLPYPITHPSNASANPSSTPQATPSGTATTGAAASTQQAAQSASNTRSSAPGAQQEQGPLYDIAKLLEAHCTILSGKVYNDKGHNICGVLNQHDKPCKRIGKCPFHGAHKPVTQENSVNGHIDASGTVATPSTSPDGTHSPPGRNAMYDSRSPGGSDTTAVNGSKPKVPPKQQYKHGWSKEEHYLFLGGLSQHGRGSWKQIAAVVKTRTPTQVQSHAQKYFQRQKQADKNKRSIHDLSLDSPEMIEVAKKMKLNQARIGLPGGGLGDSVHMAAMGDGGALKGSGSMAPSALSLSHNALQGDGRGMNDGSFGRFGNSLNSSFIPKFGQGQATSATTHGSSLSSGVQIPQLPGNAPSRSSFQTSSPGVPQQEMFGSLGQGSMPAHARRPGDMTRSPGKLETAAPGRDVILSSVRPAFVPDSYQGTNGQVIQAQHLLSGKSALYSQARVSGGVHVHEPGANVSVDQGATHAQYSASGLQSLYPQMGGNAQVFPQPRGNAEGQMAWGYDGDMKARRAREGNSTAKEAFQLQNAQLNTTLQNIGAIQIPENLTGAAGIANEQHVEQPFEAAQQPQTNAFAGGIFGSGEGVDVDASVYNVAAGGQNNSTQLNAGIPGFAGSTGAPMGQLQLRGQGAFAGNPYNRNA